VITALRHAGPSLSRLRKVLRGVTDGIDLDAPPIPPAVITTGDSLKSHLRMRWRNQT
jgi:hypothetical protein